MADARFPGAAALIRPEADDLFGLGAREAVVRALVGSATDRPAYGAAAEREELEDALREVLGAGCLVAGEDLTVRGPEAVVAALAFAHGWSADRSGELCVLRPASP